MELHRNPQTTTEILENMREIFSVESRWSHQRGAGDYEWPLEDSHFHACLITVRPAATGGWNRVGSAFETGIELIRRAIAERTNQPIAHIAITSFSDSPETTHEDLLWVLDRAIELSKEAS